MDTNTRYLTKLGLTLLLSIDAICSVMADDAIVAPDSSLAQAKVFKVPQPLVANELKAIQSVSHAVLITGATNVTYPEQEAARQTMLDLYQQLNQIVEPALQQSRKQVAISSPAQASNPTVLTVYNTLPTEGTGTGTVNGKPFASKVILPSVLHNLPSNNKANAGTLAAKSANTEAERAANDISSDFLQKINTLKVQLQQQLQARSLSHASINSNLSTTSATTGIGEHIARLHHLPERVTVLRTELLGLIESPDRIDINELQAFRDRIRPKTGVDLLKEQAALHPEQGDPLLNPTPTISTITQHIVLER